MARLMCVERSFDRRLLMPWPVAMSDAHVPEQRALARSLDAEMPTPRRGSDVHRPSLASGVFAVANDHATEGHAMN